MSSAASQLPAVTLVIEWENAIDVEDEWTGKAMAALEREIRATAPRMPARPRIMYLYDKGAVAAGTIDHVLGEIAPGLREVADVEIMPTEGLTYYQLKNFGVARSKTDLTLMIDSDAAPQPGWMEAMLAPFADPEVMAVGGFTMLGYEDFLSRTMALSWIFNLADEGEKAARRKTVHVNNFAVRTAFFRDHPFPDLPAFKKQCVFWLRAITAQGHRYVRTEKARATHAPHPGVKFLAWRAWTGGLDSDFVAYHTRTRNPVGRFLYSFVHFAKKVGRAWGRILAKGGTIGLPLWQRPFSLLVALAYYLVLLAAQLTSSLTRRFDPLPPFKPMPAITA